MRFADAIDRLNARAGRAASWVGLAMVLIAALNAIGGSLDSHFERRLSFVALDEAEWYLFTVLFLFAAPWALREGSHVRVDVLYGRLGPRGKARIDLAGCCLLLVPFATFAAFVTAKTAIEMVRVREVSPDAGGLPRYPLQVLVPIAFVLLALQGVATAIRAKAILSEAKATQPSPDRTAEDSL